MIELEDDGSEEPQEIAIDSVFRSTDADLIVPRRVQVVSIDEETDTLVACAITPEGRAFVKHGTFTYQRGHFRWGDAWVPDDTGLPVVSSFKKDLMDDGREAAPLPDSTEDYD